jgi:CelD/BcsL family acetyltransferase involved in cellulose biosynthesis
VQICVIDPLTDPRWDDLVACHPKASVFHHRAWLQALTSTYGYQPFALTSAKPGEPLEDGIVFCRVASWITGTRSVSLPFADHCEPLVRSAGDLNEFISWLQVECDRQRWGYVELRPLSERVDWASYPEGAESYCLHTLDLTPALDDIFKGLHKDSIQRKIRRAEREQLSYEMGRSEKLASQFYQLLLKTRRRHHLVPQPRIWFRNLMRFMGDRMEVRVAGKDGTPVAALLTLRHGSSVVYKYGCSDERHHTLGGMPFLFWKLIAESKESGLTEVDFGRSSINQLGLTTFKDRFGTTRKPLPYFRYSPSGQQRSSGLGNSRAMRKVFSILPAAVLPAVGRMLYRHMG